MIESFPKKAGKHICPACGPTRRNKRDRSLSVTKDESGWVCHCHNCGETGYDNDNSRKAPGMDRGARDRRGACREIRTPDPRRSERLLAGNPLHRGGEGYQSQVPPDKRQAAQDGPGRAPSALECRRAAIARGEGRESPPSHNRRGMGRLGGDPSGAPVRSKRSERCAIK